MRGLFAQSNMLQDELAQQLGVGKSQLAKWKARGCPVDDVGAAKAWRAANIRPRRKRKASPADTEPASGPVPASDDPATGDDDFSPEARLCRARKIERAIYE